MVAVVWVTVLQEAGIPAKLAPTIGIAVDHRRKNRSLEGLQVRQAGRHRRQAGGAGVVLKLLRAFLLLSLAVSLPPEGFGLLGTGVDGVVAVYVWEAAQPTVQTETELGVGTSQVGCF